MTFNSSCSYAGIANMLDILGYDTEDYLIALGMKLPYILGKENDTYVSGPMLQTKEWFNLYLKPNGFKMEEINVPKTHLLNHIVDNAPCMFGAKVNPNSSSKHALVFIGMEDNKYRLINNKRETSDEPTYYLCTEDELLSIIDDEIVVASIKQCEKESQNLERYHQESLKNIDELKNSLKYMCSKVYSKNELKVLQEKIFRSILLDNITVLKLASEKELVAKFETVQKQFLMVVRSDPDNITLTDYIDIDLLLSAMSDWYELIKNAFQ